MVALFTMEELYLMAAFFKEDLARTLERMRACLPQVDDLELREMMVQVTDKMARVEDGCLTFVELSALLDDDDLEV